MGKTRDLFKKSRDTKGTFHAKMGSIKDRNGMDLTEVENIKKRWQKHTHRTHSYMLILQTETYSYIQSHIWASPSQHDHTLKC